MIGCGDNPYMPALASDLHVSVIDPSIYLRCGKRSRKTRVDELMCHLAGAGHVHSSARNGGTGPPYLVHQYPRPANWRVPDASFSQASVYRGDERMIEHIQTYATLP